MLHSLPLEVLNNICRSLSFPRFSVPYRHAGPVETLASLARTSRLLHEPAVSALWGTIPDFAVIIYTLPEDLWLGTRATVSRGPYLVCGTQLSFKRPPVQSDFARLEHYAPRIKCITQADVGLIALDVLEALAIHSPAGILLPNIHTLQYRCFSSTQSEMSHVLFGPKLGSVCHMCSCSLPRQSDTEYADADNLDCIRALPRICPALSRFAIDMEPISRPLLVSALSDIIRSFEDLTSVVVTGIPLDLPAISHLGRLQNLDILHASPSDEITQADTLSLTSTSTNGQAYYFPSLRTMIFKNRFLALSTWFLKFVSSPVLHHVTIHPSEEFGFYCTSEDISDLCLELSRHSSLTCIVVSVSSMLTGPHLGRTTFEPLLKLSDLRILDIDVRHVVDIDDTFLADMAAAWPTLLRLELCVEHPGFWDSAVYRPTATLSGLVPFVRLCPELVVLGLPVNMDVARVPRALLDQPRSASGAAESHVSLLKVGLSTVDDPVPVASFLSYLFPRLDGVVTAWRADMEEDMIGEDLDGTVGTPAEITARWEEVSSLVYSLMTVRRQERTWAATHMGRANPWWVRTPESQ